MNKQQFRDYLASHRGDILAALSSGLTADDLEFSGPIRDQVGRLEDLYRGLEEELGVLEDLLMSG